MGPAGGPPSLWSGLQTDTDRLSAVRQKTDEDRKIVEREGNG